MCTGSRTSSPRLSILILHDIFSSISALEYAFMWLLFVHENYLSSRDGAIAGGDGFE
jgi:hypothetical protein